MSGGYERGAVILGPVRTNLSLVLSSMANV